MKLTEGRGWGSVVGAVLVLSLLATAASATVIVDYGGVVTGSNVPGIGVGPDLLTLTIDETVLPSPAGPTNWNFDLQGTGSTWQIDSVVGDVASVAWLGGSNELRVTGLGPGNRLFEMIFSISAMSGQASLLTIWDNSVGYNGGTATLQGFLPVPSLAEMDLAPSAPTVTVVPIPEPSTALLTVVGLVVLTRHRRESLGI